MTLDRGIVLTVHAAVEENVVAARWRTPEDGWGRAGLVGVVEHALSEPRRLVLERERHVARHRSTVGIELNVEAQRVQVVGQGEQLLAQSADGIGDGAVEVSIPGTDLVAHHGGAHLNGAREHAAILLLDGREANLAVQIGVGHRNDRQAACHVGVQGFDVPFTRSADQPTGRSADRGRQKARHPVIARSHFDPVDPFVDLAKLLFLLHGLARFLDGPHADRETDEGFGIAVGSLGIERDEQLDRSVHRDDRSHPIDAEQLLDAFIDRNGQPDPLLERVEHAPGTLPTGNRNDIRRLRRRSKVACPIGHDRDWIGTDRHRGGVLRLW